MTFSLKFYKRLPTEHQNRKIIEILQLHGSFSTSAASANQIKACKRSAVWKLGRKGQTEIQQTGGTGNSLPKVLEAEESNRGGIEERTGNCPTGAPGIFDFWSDACHGSQCLDFCPL